MPKADKTKILQRFPLGTGAPTLHVSFQDEYLRKQQRLGRPVTPPHPATTSNAMYDVTVVFERSGESLLSINDIIKRASRSKNPHAHTKVAICKAVHALCLAGRVRVLECEATERAGIRWDYYDNTNHPTQKWVRGIVRRFQAVKDCGGEWASMRREALNKYGALGWARVRLRKHHSTSQRGV